MKKSSEAIHEKQIKSSSGLTIPILQDLTYYYKCSKCSKANEENIGRSRVLSEDAKDNKSIPFAVSQIKNIATITNHSRTENYISCPWSSYENPLWMVVMDLINQVEAGVNVDFSLIDNVVVEAFVFYKSRASSVDSYLNMKHAQEIKERNKSNQNK